MYDVQSPVPAELFCGQSRQREDLETTHEEADVTMVHQMVKLAHSGVNNIKVISDDTDVFVLSMHFYSEQNLRCNVIMEGTSSERLAVDIKHPWKSMPI